MPDNSVLTTAEVAKRLGVTPRAVRQLAQRYHVGTLLNGRMRVFTEEEYEQLAAHSTGKMGRPKQPRE